MPAPSTHHLRLQPLAQAPAGGKSPPSPWPSGTCTFSLYWDIAPAPVDEGLPPSLVQLLAQTLCALGKLTFVSDALGLDDASLSQRARALLPATALQWHNHGAYQAALVSLPAIRLAPLALVETRQADIAQRLFDIQAWHYAPCQAVCLTPAHSPQLQLQPSAWSALITRQARPAMAASLHAACIDGLVLPGHDGALLDCVFLQAASARQCIAELQRQASTLGWTVQTSTDLSF